MPVKRDYKIEACVVDYDQAIAAFEKGADRLELCSRLETEGMTPDIKLAEKILSVVNIPVRIMIRETEEGFNSDGQVLKKMELAIDQFKSLPVEGFVIGVLKNNRIDREATKRLIEIGSPFPVTFHKAIDLSENITEDILWLNQFSSLDTILTSGGKKTAMEGVPEISEMKAIFKGEIMGAGKITHDQLSALHKVLMLKWYHGRNIL